MDFLCREILEILSPFCKVLKGEKQSEQSANTNLFLQKVLQVDNYKNITKYLNKLTASMTYFNLIYFQIFFQDKFLCEIQQSLVEKVNKLCHILQPIFFLIIIFIFIHQNFHKGLFQIIFIITISSYYKHIWIKI